MFLQAFPEVFLMYLITFFVFLFFFLFRFCCFFNANDIQLQIQVLPPFLILQHSYLVLKFFSESPLSDEDDYRMEVLINLRRVERLDKDEFTEEERQEAEEIYEQRRAEEMAAEVRRFNALLGCFQTSLPLTALPL